MVVLKYLHYSFSYKCEAPSSFSRCLWQIEIGNNLLLSWTDANVCLPANVSNHFNMEIVMETFCSILKESQYEYVNACIFSPYTSFCSLFWKRLTQPVIRKSPLYRCYYFTLRVYFASDIKISDEACSSWSAKKSYHSCSDIAWKMHPAVCTNFGF